MSKKSKESNNSWNHMRYWSATIALCALLIFASLSWLSAAGMASAVKISEELNMPEYLGVYVLPIGQLIAAVLILWRKFPTLRVFAYSWVLFYFVLELILLVDIRDYAMAALSVFKIVVWALAFHWDRNRIANSLPKAAKNDTSIPA
jgi:hypothetical protein